VAHETLRERKKDACQATACETNHETAKDLAQEKANAGGAQSLLGQAQAKEPQAARETKDGEAKTPRASPQGDPRAQSGPKPLA
jgi:hypothetical protein